MAEPQKKSGSIIGRIFRWMLILLLLLVATVVVIGQFVLDGKYELSREIAIKAPPAEVHKQVGDLQQWPNWLPFTKHDPSVNVTIEQPTGVGARQHWTGKSGNGELTFTASDEEKGVEFDMLFDKKYASKGSLSYAKAGDDTRVTWRMTGQNDDFVGRWMAVLMPYMVGPYFEEGLGDLKKKVEAK
jgi:hypothetical protein